MFVRSPNHIEIGDRVQNLTPLKLIAGTFTKGHLFRVIGICERGFDLIDEENHILITEAGWNFERI